MAFDFPASPSEGQQYTPPGSAITYVWNSPTWKSIGATRILMSDTAPANPAVGTMWWESDTGNTYIWYQDADGSQWVQQNIVGTPGQDEIWNGQYMKWNTSASLGGLWWTAAGLGIGWKTGPSRFIINSAEDFSGTDVFSVSDAGVVTGNVITSVINSVITSSGTYTKPAGLKYLEVECVGGGGGGGGIVGTAAGQYTIGGGGAGGAWCKRLYTAAELSATTAMTVGAAGAAIVAASGGTGGGSAFKGMTAPGGSGGSGGAAAGSGSVQAGGGTGAVATGDMEIQRAGGYGTPGISVFALGNNLVGAGGSSMYCGEGYWVLSNSQAGLAGRGFGGGGGGASNGPSLTQRAGGAGGAGCIILREYF